MYPTQHYLINNTIVGVAQTSLLAVGDEAVMLSANNKLLANQNNPSWSLEVERRAGKAYGRECRQLVAAAGPDGISRGSAVMTGGNELASGRTNRWVIQAITIHYDAARKRTPADPQTIYGAVRAGLEKAELFHVTSVAVYLFAQRHGYGAATPDQLALALCDALLDHAAISGWVQRLTIREADPEAYQRAAIILQEAFANRG